ncbi:putative toxin-antitoxin system toxin component, PIN family [Thermodesulfitimonas autotrophica]|uniref:putative toxin-antitoxin system toxin component, PIN family n=1 Tax=Thermodesulfitimonas autotrophica TaxID=1894989 RepID=UPI002FE31EB2
MTVVLDTNVVVSGILVPAGPPGKIVDLWVDGAFTVAVSPALVKEYLGVLLRPKFRSAGSAAERTRILEALLNLENTVTILPKRPVSAVAEDPADNRVLECAEASGAECIVSGDRHLLALGGFGPAAILSPAGFLKRFFGMR